MLRNQDKKVVFVLMISLLLLGVIFKGRQFALDPKKPLGLYIPDSWKKERGLQADIITGIGQTSDGYLWLGTEKGLLKYDGLRFTPVFPPSGVWGNGTTRINRFIIDRDDVIWVGTRAGLYKLEGDRWTSFAGQLGIPTEYISSVYRDSYDALWLGVSGHCLFRYKDKKFTLYDHRHGLPRTTVTGFHEDRSGTLWLSTVQHGVYIYRGEQFVKHNLNLDKNIYSQGTGPSGTYSVYAFYEDSQGILWLGTNMGVIGVAGAGTKNEKIAAYFTPKNGLIDNNVWTIHEDRHRNLWVGTERGLNRIINPTSDKPDIAAIFQDAIVEQMFEDREGSLWLGTVGEGLKRLRDSTVFKFEKKKGVPYWRKSLFQTTGGDILVGSNVGELYRFDDKEKKLIPVLTTFNNVECEIYALEEGEDGSLWMGTITKGIFHLDKNSLQKRIESKTTINMANRMTYYTVKNGLTQNRIRCLLKDSRGWMWIGTFQDGVTSYRNNRFYPLTLAEGLVSNRVTVIREDRARNIWVGTLAGITVLEKGRSSPRFMTNHQRDKKITDIHEDENGVFWIATLESGLLRFKGNRWTSFTGREGLHDNLITILSDHLGNLWISTIDGIITVPKHSLEVPAGTVEQGRTKRIPCRYLGLSEGVPDLNFRYGANNAALKTKSGELWFATRKGIAVVNPEKVIINKIPPPVVIDEALFNFEPVPPDLQRKRYEGIKDIRIRFAVLTFISPEKIKIKYRLDGHDPDSLWHTHSPTLPRQVVYKHLPPGEYGFRVEAANANGIWNNDGAEFTFILQSYFYQTLLFKIIMSLLALLVMVGAYFGARRYLYIRKLKNKYQSSTLDAEKAEKCLQKLQFLMTGEKIYRDETMTLQTLAAKLAIPPRYLSQIINERLNKNFRDFLNGYRIEEARKRLKDPAEQERAVLAIAFAVGFNSKEVFNRVFKKATGKTPSQYRKEKAVM